MKEVFTENQLAAIKAFEEDKADNAKIQFESDKSYEPERRVRESLKSIHDLVNKLHFKEHSMKIALTQTEKEWRQKLNSLLSVEPGLLDADSLELFEEKARGAVAQFVKEVPDLKDETQVPIEKYEVVSGVDWREGKEESPLTKLIEEMQHTYRDWYETNQSLIEMEKSLRNIGQAGEFSENRRLFEKRFNVYSEGMRNLILAMAEDHDNVDTSRLDVYRLLMDEYKQALNNQVEIIKLSHQRQLTKSEINETQSN